MVDSCTMLEQGVGHDVPSSWRTQRIMFELPGLGTLSVTADPGSVQEDQRAASERAVLERSATPDHRCKTTHADLDRVVAAEAARERVELPDDVVVVPALGPIIPTQAPTVTTTQAADGTAEFGLDVPEPAAAPGEGVGRHDRKWLRTQQVLDLLWGVDVVTGIGALAGADRRWFEPAIAVTSAAAADAAGRPVPVGSPRRTPAVSPRTLLDAAYAAAREQGQAAVLHIHDGVLDVLPTGLDPRVPYLESMPVRITRRPGACPLTGDDRNLPCRAAGGPGSEEDIRERLAFDGRRALAVGLLGCGVCHGRRRTDDGLGGTVDVPLPLSMNLDRIPRITLRTGETVEIDALEDIFLPEEPF